eukprot:1189878-Prorocentrum_minimum.AAC.7
MKRFRVSSIPIDLDFELLDLGQEVGAEKGDEEDEVEEGDRQDGRQREAEKEGEQGQQEGYARMTEDGTSPQVPPYAR